MFREIRDVKQERGSGRRRWFESDGFDLVVWLDGADAVTGFQICYDLGRGEHALTWRMGVGFTHNEIDSGESSPLRNETPVLVPAGSAPWPILARDFAARAATLEPGLKNFVQEKLTAEAFPPR